MILKQLSFKISAIVLGACIFALMPACGKKAGSTDGIASDNPELVELTKQLRRYSFEKHKMPESLDELVAAGYLKAIPPAPAGKKFAVDAKRAEVIVMDK